MATFKKLTIGGSGSGSAKIAPIVINDVGTYDATSPHIVTETWTENDTFDIQFNWFGTPMSCAKAKKISALTLEHGSMSINGVMNGEAISVSSPLEPITEVGSLFSMGGAVTAYEGAPIVLWVISASIFSEYIEMTECPFEDNTVYICDAFTLGNATGEISITSMGTDEVDAFLPVTVDLNIEDLEVSPTYGTQIFELDGQYYKKVTVKSLNETPNIVSNIQFNPYKTVYKIGESLSYTVGTLDLYYTNGDVQTNYYNITSEHVSGFEEAMSAGVGEHVLTVTYGIADIARYIKYTIRIVEDLEVTEPGTYDTTNNTSVTVNIPEYDGTIEEIS